MMKFEHRSYSNHYTLPQPTVNFDPLKKTFVSSTPWGKPFNSKSYIDQVFSIYFSQKEDSDSTRPLQHKEHLDFNENSLRNAMIHTNNQIYKEHNANDYSCGLEILIGSQVGHALYLAICGPYTVLLNRNKSMSLVYGNKDLSGEFSLKDKKLSPLPKSLLGTYKDMDINLLKIHCKKNDQFIFIKRSQVQKITFKKSDQLHIGDIANILTKSDKELPFWLATLNLG